MNELELFAAAFAVTDPVHRAALLDRECVGKSELRARLDELLAAHVRSNPLLDQPLQPVTVDRPPDAVPATDVTAAETAGMVIAGKYKLLQQIGEGGMGTVWMADQSEPVKRRVALKLMRVERGQSKTILSRFEAERQAIALMDHPHIARLLDAGVDLNSEPRTLVIGQAEPLTNVRGSGRPFFVMELVKGVPLTDYCDAHKLGIAERLKLFVQICSAVQHAHQKGIIHRDLKPSNILVESHDGKPVPKVIDFGLAKATTGLQLTEHTLFTAFGSVMGTPLYMAPEQASFNAVDVDTRADIYALGVILYELLTGTTPIARETFKKSALDEMLKLIREQEAPTPSSRLSAPDSAPSVAANRQMEPAKLGRFVKGELDWIVLKALAKERERRYETANGFARDIERFLTHEPVTAGPPTAAYRLRKFVRRNRGQAVAASLVLVALVGGVIGTTFGFIRAEQQRLVAEQAREETQQRAEAERLAKLRAEAFQKQAQAENEAGLAVLGFFRTHVLGAARPEQLAGGLGAEVTVRSALESAEAKVATAFPNQPTVEASIRCALGQTYTSWGEAERAARQYKRAAELSRETWGPNDDFTAQMINSHGEACLSLGKFELAIPLFREAIPILSAKFGPDHVLTCRSMENLITSYEGMYQFNDAEPWHRKLLATAAERSGAQSTVYANALARLGLNLTRQQNWTAAEPLLRECLAIREKQIPDSWFAFNAQSMLGGALLGQKKYTEAEALLVKGYQGMKTREKAIPKQGGAELRIPEALDRLIELNTAINKPEEVKKWRAERAKYPQGKTKTSEKK
jgi:serine/threonine protein kinase/tetratricopeptide (TPR) repeat protein